MSAEPTLCWFRELWFPLSLLFRTHWRVECIHVLLLRRLLLVVDRALCALALVTIEGLLLCEDTVGRHRRLARLRIAVRARLLAVQRHHESEINADQGVEEYDDDLDCEVEDVEGGGMKVVGQRTDTADWCLPRCTRAVGGAKADQDGPDEADDDLRSEATSAELDGVLALRDDHAQRQDGDRQERDHSEVGRAVELDVAVDAAGVVGECEEGLRCSDDDHHDGEEDDNVVRCDECAERLRPTPAFVASAGDADRELDVDDIQEQHASSDEDLRGDS